MDVLILRFDAPMVSFGAPIVDNLGVIQRFPGLSMLTGLFANALGYDHGESQNIQSLQRRLDYAARCDRQGSKLQDYQTVDLGQDFMIDKNTAWTTRGRVDNRAGGKAKEGTHIRIRDYWADSIHTVAVSLADGEASTGRGGSSARTPGSVSVKDLESALRRPERPLFVGRKCCLPASPLHVTTMSAPSPLAALCRLPRLPEQRTGVPSSEGLPAWWTEGDSGDWVPGHSRQLLVTDERDWLNQLHGGSRLMRHGLIHPPVDCDQPKGDSFGETPTGRGGQV